MQDNFYGYILKPHHMLLALFTILIGLVGLIVSENISKYMYLKSYSGRNIKKSVHYDLRNSYLFFLISIFVAFIQIFLMLTGEVGYGTFEESTTSDFSFLFQVVFILSSYILSIFAILKYLFRTFSKKCP